MLQYFFGNNGKSSENKDPVLALQEQLDLHENFEILSDGTMKFDDFIAFRCIIMRQMLRKHQPEKERLQVLALEHLKNNAERDYVANYLE
jgi:hypothetical protein